jgi:predicted DNA-binding ribbon-helix-helix protein
MIRKTMRVGQVRTSIKLEEEFWSYLKQIADDRQMRLSALVNEVADSTPDRTNLASTLRVFALVHARVRSETLQKEMCKLSLAGNTQDLLRVMEACPLPCLVMDHQRQIRQLNRSFAFWLNLDARATIGQRLDNIMILRGPGMKDMWTNLLDGRTARAGFNATYVSPGKVRTAQAIAVALAPSNTEPDQRGCIVLFETLSGRS